MPQPSKIEWTHYTSNPIVPVVGGWGCTKVSPGCANCCSETINKRFGNKRDFTGSWKFEVKEYELKKLLTSKAISGKRVFVCDMCDTFHEDVGFDLIDQLFAVFARRQDVTFQVLTKRPQRMAEYLNIKTDNREEDIGRQAVSLSKGESNGLFEFPLTNVWLGTSVEDQKRADERIHHLIRCPAAVRFLSCEPLLGDVKLTLCERVIDIQRREYATYASAKRMQRHIHWVIVGGESGTKARPCNVEWIRSIVDQCKSASVPVFVKQLGSRPEWGKYGGSSGTAPQSRNAGVITHTNGGDPSEWPEDLRVRQIPE